MILSDLLQRRLISPIAPLEQPSCVAAELQPLLAKIISDYMASIESGIPIALCTSTLLSRSFPLSEKPSADKIRSASSSRKEKVWN